VRAAVLLATFLLAFRVMHDIGFTPDRSERPVAAIRTLFRASVKNGLGNPPVRYIMLAAPFSAGISFYVFYALQPYLLELWGDEKAYSIAGLAAAIVAGAQIVGGLLAPFVRRLFRKRTTTILLASATGSVLLLCLGLTRNFWLALLLLTVWGITYSLSGPVRSAYLNDLIPSKQRATVLSFDSLIGNAGGVVVQPPLGRAADVAGYPFSLVLSGAVSAVALPFLLLSRRQNASADVAVADPPATQDDVSSPPPQSSGAPRIDE
jgi:MFS family permease